MLADVSGAGDQVVQPDRRDRVERLRRYPVDRAHRRANGVVDRLRCRVLVERVAPGVLVEPRRRVAEHGVGVRRRGAVDVVARLDRAVLPRRLRHALLVNLRLAARPGVLVVRVGRAGRHPD